MEKSLVSVIMPAYNAQEMFLREAVSSVLQQTYSNFELLIIDDGSVKPVIEAISDILDKRIQVHRNDGNHGLPYSLNRGIEVSKGKYIFRMDADDKCMPTRFEKQVVFLEENNEIDVVSTFANTFGTTNTIYRSGTTDEMIKAELLWKNPVVHPTAAIRAKTVKENAIKYSSEFTSEDYELWSLMAFQHSCKFAVIPQELLYYRIHGAQITKTKKEKLQVSEKIILGKTFRCLGIELSNPELDLYCSMRNGEMMNSKDFNSVICVMKKVLKNIPFGISAAHLKHIYRKAIIKYCKKYKKIISLSGVLRL